MSEAVVVIENTGQLFTAFRRCEQDMSTGNVIQLSSVGLPDTRCTRAATHGVLGSDAHFTGRRIVTRFPTVRDPEGAAQ